ncbi:PE-PGRS family protein [Emticicia oligotrophica]|uniref:PE-PGRS family protein n=1 Tax=Emticicia oligotrophica TaxID=312279 RepID=UPI00273C3C4B|nr:PE-PGRS family protein [Emticicia oligotrophica]
MKKVYLYAMIWSLFSCDKSPKMLNPAVSMPEYESTPQTFVLPNFVLDEASGLCDSKSMEGKIWVNEDSGNPSILHLLNHNGRYEGNIQLPFPNRDWEDMTIVKNPIDGKNYVYIADIGDNAATYNNEYYLYKFIEPKSINETVTNYERIKFSYPDGSRDAEAFLVDPQTNDIYIVTKRESKVKIYQLSYPQSIEIKQTAEFIKEVDNKFITSGEISTDGKEIVLKSYLATFYWYRKSNESIESVFSRNADKVLSIRQEVQEEGVCFEKNGKGIFSIGERNGETFSLYFFRKK